MNIFLPSLLKLTPEPSPSEVSALTFVAESASSLTSWVIDVAVSPVTVTVSSSFTVAVLAFAVGAVFAAAPVTITLI